MSYFGLEKFMVKRSSRVRFYAYVHGYVCETSLISQDCDVRRRWCETDPEKNALLAFPLTKTHRFAPQTYFIANPLITV